MTTLDVAATRETCSAVLDEIERAVVGKRAVLRDILATVLVGGHVLIEDLPGVGKTLVARSFATVLGLSFKRIQFTPDLLPADLTGSSLYDPARAEFVFRPGPVFTNLLLADEINRTPPRTQAALLEAMAEGQVSADGVTHRLPQPFVVLATDNPVEYEGTYALPEAQLDRFAVRVEIGYLPVDGETEMLRRRVDRAADEVHLRPVTDADELLRMRETVEQVEVHPDVMDYVVRLVDATRRHANVVVGASPRGALTLMQLARAHALLEGRHFTLADDVKACAVQALGHRLSLRPELWVRAVTGAQVVRDLLDEVPVPGVTGP
jgi:MoxR-like ATPase